jgi:hypothetical protein
LDYSSSSSKDCRSSSGEVGVVVGNCRLLTWVMAA